MRDVVRLTIRIPKSLHKKVKEIEKLENKSLNEIIRELLKNWSRKGEEKLIYDAFSKVYEDDVEYALHAQSEVVLNENSEKI
jgi:predicted CopG family antitoxin